MRETTNEPGSSGSSNSCGRVRETLNGMALKQVLSEKDHELVTGRAADLGFKRKLHDFLQDSAIEPS
jgi:hypothetical protein